MISASYGGGADGNEKGDDGTKKYTVGCMNEEDKTPTQRFLSDRYKAHYMRKDIRYSRRLMKLP
jgi:hypothetical protein